MILRPGRLPRGSRRRDDRGSQFVEFGAYFPLLLVTVVIAMEVFLAFLAMERMESAARAGARVAAESGTNAGRQATLDALPSWLDDSTIEVGMADNSYFTQVEARMPIMFSSSGLEVPMSRRVEMPAL